MFLTRSEYDRGVNTFSPEGRLFQVEYAIEAIKLGSTAMGIQTKEGVLLVCEKRITSPLMEAHSVEKIMKIDSHIGCTTSGLIGDTRTLVDRARVEALNYWFVYGEQISVEGVTQAVSNLALEFGDDDAEAAMSRPFGVAMLFAGVDKTGPRLFNLDPSGTFIECSAKAIGAACESAQQCAKLQEITLREAQLLTITILKQVMEEKVTSTNIEMSVINKKDGYVLLPKEELEELIKA
ncbi:putative multicatalytic endopeptidase [Trichuris suis]|nr:putative multicatalytic endopeptidase [Trichuris suis]